MDISAALGRCLAYLGSHSEITPEIVPFRNQERMSVAISRETGSGAIRIAETLAKYLQTQAPCACGGRPWTVFDKTLIDTILDDQHLPKRLARFLPEERVSAIRDTVDEILGLHPPSWVIIRESAETILRLAELGKVILVGRGATVITKHMPFVLRVRLVGSLERRIARVQEMEHLTRPEAAAYIRRSDRGRLGYAKEYFHKDLRDALLHDVTINTDQFSENDVAQLIGKAMMQRLPNLQPETLNHAV